MIALTIDANVQKPLEELARERAHALGPDISVAIVAVDHATGEVLARVAGADYFDERRAGQVDMTQAVRSPGSTLKPFIYGLALRGRADPSRDADRGPAGALRQLRAGELRSDVPGHGVGAQGAADVAQRAGGRGARTRSRANRLTARITDAGARFVLPKGEVPGLAMGLGGVGVTLTDLTMLYAGLARGGDTIALTERRDAHRREPAQRRLLDPVAAWYVGNVLIGTPPPENAAGGRIAFKTGTSYGYRDAWSVGFDGKRTIGVWVGRPDGAPVPGLVGRARRGADPVRRVRAARRLAGAAAARRRRARSSPRNNRLPPPLQRFRRTRWRGEAPNRAAHHVPAERRAAELPPKAAIRDGAENFRRRAAADPAGQWRAAADRGRAAARCSSPPTGRALRGSP